MSKIADESIQKLTKWWLLDMKNGARSVEELAEYDALTSTLIADCKLRDLKDLRKLAIKIAAQKLKQAI